MMGATEVPEGIRVLDDSHLQITLSEPFEGYIYQLASPSCSILSESFVKEAGDDYGSCAEMTMGSGPYRVTAFSENEISLEKNPYYQCRENETLSASKVKLQVLPPALMYQKFQEGGLDILDTNMINPDAVNDLVHMDQYADRIVYRSSVTIQYLMMNMQSPLLKDIRIRKAIQMAIDRKGILDELYGGAGSLIDGIYPKGLFGFCEENQGWLSYDPEEAKRLIAEVPDAGKIPVELAANYQNSARRLTLLEMIQQDLNDVGLRADIVSYDGDTMMYLRRNSSLMLYTGEWSADFNDPDNFIYTLFGSRGKTYSRSSNFQVPSVFARIQKARGIQDREQRMQEYADLERILVQENAVWVPLFSTEHLFVLGDRVESFSPFWAGWSSMYFRDVVLKEGK
jgi:ABC-type oligopeptide transport system substrate-binding subunit